MQILILGTFLYANNIFENNLYDFSFFICFILVKNGCTCVNVRLITSITGCINFYVSFQKKKKKIYIYIYICVCVCVCVFKV